MGYKKGIAFTLGLCVLVPLFTPEPQLRFQQIFSSVSPPFLLLACLAGWLAAASFLVPHAVLLLVEKKNITAKNLKAVLYYAYALIVSRDADRALSDELGADLGAVKLADLVSLNLLLIMIPFIENKLFFYVNSALILSLTVCMARNRKLPRHFPALVLACILRFLIEFPKTLFMFLALGISLPLQTVYAFMLGSSVLYQFRAFPSAGGLLELYAVLFFTLYGNPLLGLVLGLLFHLCALVTFVIPLRLVESIKGYCQTREGK